jgi:hypothetical protein
MPQALKEDMQKSQEDLQKRLSRDKSRMVDVFLLAKMVKVGR